MTVTVRLFATFRQYPGVPRPRSLSCRLGGEYQGGETVRDLLAGLQLPDDPPRIVLVNGQYAAEHPPLSRDDQIAVFPPLIRGYAEANL